MTTVVAPIAGPILGGTIAEGAGWQWVFFINTPIALACAAAAILSLRKQETKIEMRPIDYVGLVLLVIWVGALQIMLDKGKEADWFSSSLIVGLLIVAAVGFAVFMIWELTSANPVVDLRVFRKRSFSISVLTMALTYGAFFSSVVLLPLWLQTNLQYTSTWAGYAVAFNGVLAVVMSPIVAQGLMPCFDARYLVAFGVLMLALVSFWRGHFASTADFWSIATPQLLQGFVMPFFFVSLTALALSELSGSDVASGAGLMNFVRTTSGSFATSMTTTAWEDAASRHRGDLVGSISTYTPTANDAIAAYGAFGVSTQAAVGSIDRLVDGQAVMLATNEVFLSCAVIFLISMAAILFVPKPRKALAPTAAH